MGGGGKDDRKQQPLTFIHLQGHEFVPYFHIHALLVSVFR